MYVLSTFIKNPFSISPQKFPPLKREPLLWYQALNIPDLFLILARRHPITRPFSTNSGKAIRVRQLPKIFYALLLLGFGLSIGLGYAYVQAKKERQAFQEKIGERNRKVAFL